jgi:3-hydroxyisobutyrate dehydrogenase
MTTIAVLGTGDMGAAMARALVRAGFGVRVWNRTRAKAAPLAEVGAVVLDDPRDAVRGADVVFTVVFDAAAVLDVLDRVSDSLERDAVVVQCATVGFEIDAVSQAANELGIALVDTPLLGNPNTIEAGTLNVMASGRPELRARVAPVLDALSPKVIWVGDTPGAASSLKLVCNAWVQGLNTVAAQSFALAQAFGLDPHDFLTAISGTIADSPYPHVKAAIMLGESQEAAVPIDSLLEGLRLIGAAAGERGVSTVLIDAVVDVYETASNAGYGKEDAAAVTKVFAPRVHSAG